MDADTYATLLIMARQYGLVNTLLAQIMLLRAQRKDIMDVRQIDRDPKIDEMLVRLGNKNPEADKAHIMVQIKLRDDNNLKEIKNKIMESGALSIQTIAPIRYVEKQ